MNTYEHEVAYLLGLPEVPTSARDAIRAASDEQLRAAIDRGLAREPLADRIRRREVRRALHDALASAATSGAQLPKEWLAPEAVVIDRTGPTPREVAEVLAAVAIAACGTSPAIYRDRWVVMAPRSCVEAVDMALSALAAGDASLAHTFIHHRYNTTQ